MPAIPFVEHNPNMSASRLHFAHANGYPPQAYEPFLERLAERFHVTAMEARPLWENQVPHEVRDWSDFAGDLITFMEQSTPLGEAKLPLIGVGHSLGGTVTLMAAIHRPDLFKALILMDPPFYPPRASFIWNVLFRLGLVYWFHPLIKGAVNRRNHFESREAMFAHYRRKKVFEQMDNRGLWAYVHALAAPSSNGAIHLRYPPQWEARIYATSLLRDWKTWQNLHGFALPILLLRPEHGAATPDKTVKRLQKLLPHAVVKTIPGTTHLAPLEKPEQVAEMILKFLG